MFYCDACAEKTGWPKTIFKSYGLCEICNIKARCNDRPAKLLEPSKKEEKHKDDSKM